MGGRGYSSKGGRKRGWGSSRKKRFGSIHNVPYTTKQTKEAIKAFRDYVGAKSKADILKISRNRANLLAKAAKEAAKAAGHNPGGRPTSQIDRVRAMLGPPKHSWTNPNKGRKPYKFKSAESAARAKGNLSPGAAMAAKSRDLQNMMNRQIRELYVAAGGKG